MTKEEGFVVGKQMDISCGWHCNLDRQIRQKYWIKEKMKLISDEYLQKWIIPKDLQEKNKFTYVPSDYIGHNGIGMNIAKQIKLLKKWREKYSHIFKKLREDPQINTLCMGKNYLHNKYYPTPDAEIYAAMILDTKPLNIIEIGSGFSTIIAKTIVSQIDNDCKIITIDPEPRTAIKHFADMIIYKPIEDLKLKEIPTNKKKTILFIDSSHITRSRGDVPCIYNKILPNLPSGTLIQVHDVFLPFDYPFKYQERLYTEQYILHALLSYSTKYKIIFATHYMVRKHPKLMQEVFGYIVGKDDLYHGASLWFKTK